MLPLLLLPLLWGGSPQEEPGLQLHVQEAAAVQEGLCALVPCSFSYPGSLWPDPPRVSWFWGKDSVYYDPPVATNKPGEPVKTQTRGRFHVLGDPGTNSCSLHVADARRSDSGTYLLRVEKGGRGRAQYKDKRLDLQVTELTEKPDIRFREPLQSGRPTNLSCSLPGACEGPPAPTFSWSGAALSSSDPRARDSPVLTLTPSPQDHGTSLTCRVQLREGATERTVGLWVSYAPRNLTIGTRGNGTAPEILPNASSLPIPEGQALWLRCAADGNPPAQLSWFRGSPALNASPISNSGVLELPRVGTVNEGELACRAKNALGSAQVSLRLSVLYPPQLLGPSCSWEAEGLLCSCSARARPAPSLRWRLGDRLVEANGSSVPAPTTSSSAGPWAHSNLSLRGGLGPGLTLSCEARNALGEQRVAVLLLPGKPESRAGVVLGAIGGAGTMALISLSLYLAFFCIVKARRKQAAGKPEGTDDEDPVMGTVAWGSRRKPWPDASPDQEPPSGDGALPGEEQTLHYASLSFHRMKSWEPEGPRATATEYSEIKSRQTNKDLPRPQSWPEESQPVWGERRSQGLTDEA